jgi:hypothetical protein
MGAATPIPGTGEARDRSDRWEQADDGDGNVTFPNVHDSWGSHEELRHNVEFHDELQQRAAQAQDNS